MKKILILLFSVSFSLSASELTGRDIIVKMESAEKVYTSQMNIKLTHTEVRREKEKIRIREMIRSLKRYTSGEYISKSLFRFIKPDIVRGAGFLVNSYRSGANEQWLFLPKLKTAKQIESKEKTKRFMNTEFSYEDLESFNQSDEQYFLVGEDNIDDTHCYIVEVICHTQTSYKRRLIWIDSVDWLLYRVEFYDKNNNFFKELTVSDYQKFGQYNFALKMIMKNIQTNSCTIMDISDIKYNIDLPDSYFTKQSLVKP